MRSVCKIGYAAPGEPVRFARIPLDELVGLVDLDEDLRVSVFSAERAPWLLSYWRHPRMTDHDGSLRLVGGRRWSDADSWLLRLPPSSSYGPRLVAEDIDHLVGMDEPNG